MIEYVYVVVRTDIPLEQQIVQACHGALEAGFSSEKPAAHPHLVLCQVRNEKELLEVAGYLETRGIDFEMFHEPWWDMGYSALATELTTRKEVFKKMRLWKWEN